jgi:hypothetical protein
MDLQFSDTLNQDAIGVMLAFATNPTTANKRDTLRAAFVLVDYASQFLLSDGTPAGDINLPKTGYQPKDGCVYPDLQTALKACQSHRATPQEGGINWLAVVQLVLKELPAILALFQV